MIIAERSEKAPPERTWGLADKAIRLVVLVVLLFGGVLVFMRAFPHEVSPARLVQDLHEGKVSHLEREAGEGAMRDGGTVRWSTGLLNWYETSVPGPGWPSGAADPRIGHDGMLERLVADSPRQVAVTPAQDLHGEQGWWENRHPAQLAQAAGLLWLLVLLVMLGDWRGRRHASRWAWFWLFTIGVVGALAYLLLEPRPLWARGGAGRGVSARQVHGITGLLAAVLLGLAAVGAAFGLRAFVG